MDILMELLGQASRSSPWMISSTASAPMPARKIGPTVSRVSRYWVSVRSCMAASFSIILALVLQLALPWPRSPRSSCGPKLVDRRWRASDCSFSRSISTSICARRSTASSGLPFLRQEASDASLLVPQTLVLAHNALLDLLLLLHGPLLETGGVTRHLLVDPSRACLRAPSSTLLTM